MRVEITEEKLLDGTTVHMKGDIINARDEEHEARLREFIRLGWAKDADTGDTGERKPGAQKLRVHNIRQDQTVGS